jgi:MtN3 and saliva related transmembrane protein
VPISEALGLIAAFLTSMSFLPQAILTLKTRNTAGVSLIMYAMFVSGVLMWVVYGFMITSWPLIIANVITFALSASILCVAIVNKFAGTSNGSQKSE